MEVELEKVVNELELSVQNADSRLDFMAMKLDNFEKKIIGSHSEGFPSIAVGDDSSEEKQGTDDEEAVDGNDVDDSGLEPRLCELLSEVTKVKKEYDALHSELRQVQVLQQEVTRSLRVQMKQVQSHFDNLRERIIGSGGGGTVPNN